MSDTKNHCKHAIFGDYCYNQNSSHYHYRCDNVAKANCRHYEEQEEQKCVRCDKNYEKAKKEISKLKAERDAAIADLTELSNNLQSCKYCKNLKDNICTYYATHPKEKANCGDGKFFKWRGVQEVEHGND